MSGSIVTGSSLGSNLNVQFVIIEWENTKIIMATMINLRILETSVCNFGCKVRFKYDEGSFRRFKRNLIKIRQHNKVMRP